MRRLMPEDIERRVRAVKALLAAFRLERIVYLTAVGIAVLMLLANGAFILFARPLDKAALGLFFGSTGLITFATGQLLKMWTQALRLVAAPTGEEAE
jgi:hypothetical protein